MAENATKQTERLATAIREMQDEGMKVNKSRLSSYMNEEKGDGISTVTIGKYFDKAMKQVNGGSSTGNASPSTGTARRGGKSEILCFYNERVFFSPRNGPDAVLSDEPKRNLERLASLEGKELVDQLCLVLEFDFDLEEISSLLDNPERFEKIEFLGYEKPAAASVTEDGDVSFEWLNFVYRVTYSDKVDDLDDDELDDTKCDLDHMLYPRLDLGGDEELDEIILTSGGALSPEVEDTVSDDIVLCVCDMEKGTARSAAAFADVTVLQPAIWKAS